MKQNIDYKTSIIFIFIVILGFFLRYYHYATFPTAGETKDEYAWTWLGRSLLTGQPPTSWSWFTHYQNSSIVTLADNPYRMVWPVFDNPPLFAIVPGIISLLANQTELTLPSITLIRFPMIILGTINLILLFLAVEAMESKTTAIIAGLFYATIPSFVFASRMVLAENLLLTFLLLAIFAVTKYLKTNQSFWFFLTAIASGLSLLTKVSGVIVPAAIIIYYLSRHKVKEAKQTALISILIGSLWLVYAAIYGWSVFWQTQFIQAGQHIGWGTSIQLFLKPFLVEQPFFDGYWFLGLLYLFNLFIIRHPQTRNKYLIPISFFLSWLGFYLLTTGETTAHGWYRYPLFPLIAILIARTYRQATDFLTLLPLILIAILPSLRLLLLLLKISPSSNCIRIITLSFLSLGFLKLINLFKPIPRNHFSKWILLSLIIIINSMIIFNISQAEITQDFRYFFPIFTM